MESSVGGRKYLSSYYSRITHFFAMALHTQTIILHLLIITVGTLLVPNVVCGTPLLSTSSSAALFGIRGGAFFGFGRKNNSGGGDGDDDPNRRFPALSQEGEC